MAKSKLERRGLGRGLSALMSEIADDQTQAQTPRSRRADISVPIDRIDPNPDQPRRQFTREALEELAASLKAKGVIQPLILRPHPTNHDRFQIVAGERRWRAAQMAQLHEVPAVVRDFDDSEVLEIGIVENIQRADLNPIEEARGYRQLIERFGHTQEKLAEAMGKSRSHIANLMRLLALPEEVRRLLEEGRLSAGHARALITADDPVGLARQVLSRGLSVRATEQLAKSAARRATTRPARPAEKDADTRALEQDLSAALGLKVAIEHRPGSGAGDLSISYRSLEELDELCQLLSRAGGRSSD